MRASFTILCLLSFVLLSAQTELEFQLFALPDVVFKKIASPEGYEAAYELKIKQPIDHNNPDLGHFYQRVWLSHLDHTAPMAIITNGYGRPSNRITEVAKLAGANQLNVEHRYFLESSPDSLDYEYLDFEQVTADLHHITTLFKQLYDGKWISSGISKGGTTTIFYRYFYPDDVEVSIPYVAPVNHSVEDGRIYDFFDKVGTAECRAAIKAYQVAMLEQAEDMKSYLKWYVKGKGLEFNYLNLDEAYEYAMLEYPFSFWQWGTDCAEIPTDFAQTAAMMNHFIEVVGLEFYSDDSMESFGSHYFQSAEEMGYYGFEVEEFKHLLKYLDTSSNPSAIFTPDKKKVAFKGDLTNKVYKWTQTTDLPFIYINGANDTWSATAVPEVTRSPSLWFFMEDKSHGDARIKNMTEVNKDRLVRRLGSWLDMEIDAAVLD